MSERTLLEQDGAEGTAGVLKKTFIALKKAQQRLEELESARSEPIAVIGLACRLPGGGNAPGAVWQMLRQGRHACSEIPDERFKAGHYYNPSPDVPGTTHTRRASMLNVPIDQFDAPFFGISAKEVMSLDPQQRLLLELAWEAIENAGLDALRLQGSRTGVYVGISSDDYAQANRHSGRLELIDGYALTGTSYAPAAGRISYTLGLEGPSLAVDTACSSSLVAMHLACQGLRNGETDLALAAGVNLILSPIFHIASTKLGTISPDGLCKTFDASANGYGRGEGGGMLVLKRLSSAQAAGDRILALIRGSAVNQDGKSNGLTAPNGLAQERVIRQALAMARLSPPDISYIEAHGTGTALGDPIEIEAIGRVMQSKRPAEDPVLIGTIKTNIGHLEAAAGVAGCIKTILCLQHGEIPPHLHLTQPSPHISWSTLPFRVPTALTPWPAGSKPRRAGVSSFGFSGTNAHVILEEAPIVSVPDAAHCPPAPHILPLSARSSEALTTLARSQMNFLEQTSDRLVDICHTAGLGRSHFSHRLAVVGDSAQSMVESLRRHLAGQAAPGLITAPASGRPRLAFLFTGQGSQYVGMGRGLFRDQPVFRAAIDACDAALGNSLGMPLSQLFYGPDADEARLRQTGMAQPAIFAVQYALTELWRSWGITPDIVVGHSIGEFAAAVTAGVLDLSQALALVSARGRLMQALPAGGTMVSIAAPETEVTALVAQAAAKGLVVSIAAVNSPEATVVSGSAEALSEISRHFQNKGVHTQELSVSHAFHSPLMRPMAAEFLRIAEGVTYQPAKLPMVSTVSGAKAGPGDLCSAAYWTRQIEMPVRFAAAMQTLVADGVTAFLEIGAAPILTTLARANCEGAGRVFAPSLVRPASSKASTGQAPHIQAAGDNDHRTIATSLATLYAHGVSVDWEGHDKPFDLRKVALPTYPFQRKPYYMPLQIESGGIPADDGHPWLGQKIVSPLLPHDTVLHQARFTSELPAFLREHKIFDRIISPAAAHLAMAFAAVRDQTGARSIQLDDVAFTAPLVVENTHTVQMLLEGGRGTDGTFKLLSRPAKTDTAPWLTHSSGRIVSLPPQAQAGDPAQLAAIDARCPSRLNREDFYSQLKTLGYSTGPNFQCLRTLNYGEDESWCRVESVTAVDDAAIHPGLIDSILQSVLPACTGSAQKMFSENNVLIPLHMGSIRLFGSLAGPLNCHTRISVAPGMVKANIAVFAQDGSPRLAIDDFLLKQTDKDTLYQQMRHDDHNLIHRLDWLEIQPPQTTGTDLPLDGGWVVLADNHGLGQALARRVASLGHACILLRPDQILEMTAWAKNIDSGIIRIIYCLPGDSSAECGTTLESLQAGEKAWCGSLLDLGRSIGRNPLPRPTRVWLVTQQAVGTVCEDAATTSAPLVAGSFRAFGRTFSHEYPELWGGLVDVPERLSEASLATLLGVLSGEGPTFSAKGDELALRRDGRLFAARLAVVPAQPQARGALPGIGPDTGYFLDVGEQHTLDDLTFKTRPRREPLADEVEVALVTAGLNFRDVLNALGQYPGQAGLLGFEAAGRIVRRGAGVTDLKEGDAVIVLASPGCIASHVTVPRRHVVPKPLGLSFADATSLPATFLTAHYALNVLGRMGPNDRVLIHAAAGGVGLAAVQLALRAGAEIFATAGSDEKRDFLTSLGVKHCYNSRNTDFAAAIKADTDGRGVTMVLNSLSGNFIEASFSILAHGGRFLEMGKIGIWDTAQVAALDPSLGYYPFDLGKVSREEPHVIAAMLGELLPLFARGALKPLPVTVFSLSQAKEAFRYMAQARHIGKIVLSRDGEDRQALFADRGPVTDTATYLVTGGLGALGLRLANWLVDQGARHLVLTGRRPPKAPALEVIEALRTKGIAVRTVEADVSRPEDVARLLDLIDREMPPLLGIVHAAGLLDDGMIADLTWPRFQTVMAPKVLGAWNLHQASQNRPLDFFVLFSSVAAIIGNLGQANYAAANGFLDGLAALRRQQSLPGTSINWGPWAESGMAADLAGDHITALGIRSLQPDQALRVLRQVLMEDMAQPCVIDADWAVLAAKQGLAADHGLYAALTKGTLDNSSPMAAPQTEQDIHTALRAVLPIERPKLLRAYLQDLARQTLGYDEQEAIACDQPLNVQGFDSLMSVEMRNRLNRGLGCTLPASLLFDYPTLNKIATFLLEEILSMETADIDQDAPRQSAQSLLEEIEALITK